MKILKLSFLALGMGLSGFAQADFIGVKGDVGYWFYDGKANMSSQSPEDQDLDRKGSAQLSLAFEHPIPFIPNAKIRYVADSSGKCNSIKTSHNFTRCIPT